MEENNLNNYQPSNKQKSNTGMVVFVTVLVMLVIGLTGFIVYQNFIEKDDNTNSGNSGIPISTATPYNNKDNNDVETIIDDDNNHQVATFDNIVNLWGKDVTKNKSYKIQNVVLKNKKASLYIDYIFNYEKGSNIDTNTTGKTTLTIKHGNTVLYTKTTEIEQSKSLLTNLSIVGSDYILYGDKMCSSYDANDNCLINDYDALNEIIAISYNENINMKDYLDINDFYIYDTKTNDNTIILKTLENAYGSGMWSCGDRADGPDEVQRSYKLNVISSKFSQPEKVSSVTYRTFCDSKLDKTLFAK